MISVSWKIKHHEVVIIVHERMVSLKKGLMFGMNSTGKIYGELPIDTRKVTLWSLLTGLGVGILAALGGILALL